MQHDAQPIARSYRCENLRHTLNPLTNSSATRRDPRDAVLSAPGERRGRRERGQEAVEAAEDAKLRPRNARHCDQTDTLYNRGVITQDQRYRAGVKFGLGLQAKPIRDRRSADLPLRSEHAEGAEEASRQRRGHAYTDRCSRASSRRSQCSGPPRRDRVARLRPRPRTVELGRNADSLNSDGPRQCLQCDREPEVSKPMLERPEPASVGQTHASPAGSCVWHFVSLRARSGSGRSARGGAVGRCGREQAQAPSWRRSGVGGALRVR